MENKIEELNSLKQTLEVFRYDFEKINSVYISDYEIFINKFVSFIDEKIYLKYILITNKLDSNDQKLKHIEDAYNDILKNFAKLLNYPYEFKGLKDLHFWSYLICSFTFHLSTFSLTYDVDFKGVDSLKRYFEMLTIHMMWQSRPTLWKGATTKLDEEAMTNFYSLRKKYKVLLGEMSATEKTMFDFEMAKILINNRGCISYSTIPLYKVAITFLIEKFLEVIENDLLSIDVNVSIEHPRMKKFINSEHLTNGEWNVLNELCADLTITNKDLAKKIVCSVKSIESYKTKITIKIKHYLGIDEDKKYRIHHLLKKIITTIK